MVYCTIINKRNHITLYLSYAFCYLFCVQQGKIMLIPNWSFCHYGLCYVYLSILSSSFDRSNKYCTPCIFVFFFCIAYTKLKKSKGVLLSSCKNEPMDTYSQLFRGNHGIQSWMNKGKPSFFMKVHATVISKSFCKSF